MADKHSKELAKLVYEALEEKKAQDIKIINIEGVSVLADYFYHCFRNESQSGPGDGGQRGGDARKSRLSGKADRGVPQRKLDSVGLRRYHRTSL